MQSVENRTGELSSYLTQYTVATSRYFDVADYEYLFSYKAQIKLLFLSENTLTF